jgi:AcrR family transcriptional regulator
MHCMDMTAPPRRTRLTAEQRRESILDAATGVFAAGGYRAAKVSDVAARIGVSEPVIFQNFGSKEALYAAVLDRAAHGIRAGLQALAGQHGPAADLLAHVLGPARAGGRHGPGAHGALFADAATLLADPGLTEPAKAAARTLAGHLADLLRRGQADGSIRADADPEAAAWLLLSVLAARPWRAAVMPDPDRLEGDMAGLALQALTPSGQGPADQAHAAPSRSAAGDRRGVRPGAV